MTHAPAYARNPELFSNFYRLQGWFAGHLAAQPRLVRAWLEGLPPRQPETGEPAPAAKSWRTARLSSGRRRELFALVAHAEGQAADVQPLAVWLLASVPVCTYFEITATGGAGASALGAAAADCHRQLLELRERLFLANYGLAKVAAKRRRAHDFAEMLSAASEGLLDAIDRYVPDGRAARFAHFAGYWIRYHMSRQFQKTGSVVSFPVNQHRIRRRIDRYLAGRKAGEAPPSPAQVCRELQLGRAAYFWQQRRPQVVSLHGPGSAGAEAPAMELRLCDPGPEPAALLEQAEIADRLRLLLRAQAGPAIRLMLAYTLGMGTLADAADEYLAALEALARERLAGAVPDAPDAVSSDGGRGEPGLSCPQPASHINHSRKEYYESLT